ncbi:radical SAM protein [Desulfoferrobacter suflitae]|uniref:radical SAM protein n=1 Tax=Desulfoferrobacter suflitae TaxID=2865782 RepID=UPI002164D21E|nr:radical SAM protein [Desulfoferrobacter suflitae]MCK8604062.1 radical SAM protein [Desulfoferrobacter suflitae]
MARKLSVTELIGGGGRFFEYLMCGGMFNINLEVTKRCNARCDFCDYWKVKPPAELADYVPVVKKLNPLSVGLTGGEPLLRSDLADLIAGLRNNFKFLHIGLITNGALLTHERGLELWRAGLDGLSLSLDYLDERHDRERGLPGLTRHILAVVPELRKAGVSLCFNVVMKKENYAEMPRIIRRAHEMGVKVSLSTYNCWRINNETHMIDADELNRLGEVIAEVKRLKSELGNVTTGDFYLNRVAEFVARRNVPGCTAGLNWVQVTPDGMIKRCSDHPPACHYSQWRKSFFAPTDCGQCWYSCRGAAQEPWSVSRFISEARQAL